MQLSHLLSPFFLVPAEADRSVKRLVLDSRKVQAGDVFFALEGTQKNGQNYISQAVIQNAAAIIIEAKTRNDEELTWQGNIPVIALYQLRQHLGEMAACFFKKPSQQLRMIGVTGTNGKTSCTHFIAQALQFLGYHCGIIGTLGTGFYNQLQQGEMTTPDAISLQAQLADLLNQKAEAVAMEVSSHGLVQERIRGIDFETGIFTNLSQDHLDYHLTMENYAQAKKKFFTEYNMSNLVINVDDAYGKQWIREWISSKKIIAYSLYPPRKPLACPLVYVDELRFSLQGIKAQIVSPWGRGKLTSTLMGRFNLSNILAVLSVLCLYKIPFEQALKSLNEIQPVAGRMQMLGGNNKPRAIVDYAHTPDALEQVLCALREHTRGKLICVFGCGGNRDAIKRPLMAQIAERLADQVIVTNDNPRHESAQQIINQIMQGFLHPKQVIIEPERSLAIQKSIQLAGADDCVLIAGKGAERYQQIGEMKLAFDDLEQVKRFLAENIHVSLDK